MTFAALLRKLASHYPSVRAFAEALGIDPSHLSRAMGSQGYVFDIRACLHLAEVTGESPDVILKAAGKDEIARLIHTVYGAPAASRLTPDQQVMVDALAHIDDHAIRHSLITLAQMAAQSIEAINRRRTTSSPLTRLARSR